MPSLQRTSVQCLVIHLLFDGLIQLLPTYRNGMLPFCSFAAMASAMGHSHLVHHYEPCHMPCMGTRAHGHGRTTHASSHVPTMSWFHLSLNMSILSANLPSIEF